MRYPSYLSLSLFFQVYSHEVLFYNSWHSLFGAGCGGFDADAASKALELYCIKTRNCATFYAKASTETICTTLLSDDQSRVRMTLQWVFSQFCQAHICTIQEPSRGKSFLKRFLKKIVFFTYRNGGGNKDSCELY